MLTVYPYRLRNSWVFDDQLTGLKEEAFVCGMSEILTAVVAAKAIPAAESGFTLTFAAAPIECDAVLEWDGHSPPGEASGLGNFYKTTIGGREMKGWLCPALGLYCKKAPERIDVRAGPLPEGVNPIGESSGLGRRYRAAE